MDSFDRIEVIVMPKGSKRLSLERRRAQAAYDYLKQLRQRNSFKKLTTRVQGFPIEMRSQGLTVALATLLKEDRAESRELAGLLTHWLLKESGVVSQQTERPDARRLLDYCVGCTRSEYQVLQTEALAYLEHVKRLASALDA